MVANNEITKLISRQVISGMIIVRDFTRLHVTDAYKYLFNEFEGGKKVLAAQTRTSDSLGLRHTR